MHICSPMYSIIFQSTLLMRGATGRLMLNLKLSIAQFQSTLLMRGATLLLKIDGH